MLRAVVVQVVFGVDPRTYATGIVRARTTTSASCWRDRGCISLAAVVLIVIIDALPAPLALGQGAMRAMSTTLTWRACRAWITFKASRC